MFKPRNTFMESSNCLALKCSHQTTSSRLFPSTAESVENADNLPLQKPDPEPEQEPAPLSLAEFLEAVPPSEIRPISDIATAEYRPGGPPSTQMRTPELQLYCGRCNGTRFFRVVRQTIPELTPKKFKYFFVTYICSNCRSEKKDFALAAKIDATPPVDEPATRGPLTGECYKFGEDPLYGPPVPSRLISLIGPDREIFLKGRRCENQGLGIGAFVYYRRVVENQKSRILGEIIKVAEKIGAPSALITTLTKAKAETQFKRALESVRDALPQVLLINGQNPLTLLHSALSEGVHVQTDEHCLLVAHAVRVVLTELSDRLGQALKDEAELKNAISLLTKPSP